MAPDTDALQFDDTVRLAGFAKRRRRDVVNGNAGGSLTIENAVVGVPVKHCVNAEPINRLNRICNGTLLSRKRKARGEQNHGLHETRDARVASDVRVALRTAKPLQ